MRGVQKARFLAPNDVAHAPLRLKYKMSPLLIRYSKKEWASFWRAP